MPAVFIVQAAGVLQAHLFWNPRGSPPSTAPWASDQWLCIGTRVASRPPLCKPGSHLCPMCSNITKGFGPHSPHLWDLSGNRAETETRQGTRSAAQRPLAGAALPVLREGSVPGREHGLRPGTGRRVWPQESSLKPLPRPPSPNPGSRQPFPGEHILPGTLPKREPQSSQSPDGPA